MLILPLSGKADGTRLLTLHGTASQPLRNSFEKWDYRDIAFRHRLQTIHDSVLYHTLGKISMVEADTILPLGLVCVPGRAELGVAPIQI